MTNEELKALLASRLTKEATDPVGDAFVKNPYGSITGSLIGLFKDVEGNPEERRQLNRRSAAWNLLPGVGAYNSVRRRKSLAAELGKGEGYAKPVSEALGGLSSGVLSALVGGGLGAAFTALARKKGWDWALTDKADYGYIGEPGRGGYRERGITGYSDKPIKDYVQNMSIGAGAGLATAGVASIIADIAALAKRRRTKEEQKEYENSNTALNYLIPGKAQYNAWKTLGYLQGESEA